MRTIESPPPLRVPDKQNDTPSLPTPEPKLSSSTLQQFLRFVLVGGMNTAIDLLVLNCLLWLWPTQNTAILLLDNSIAYAFGGVNSFMLNKYWTFQLTGRTNTREVSRFVLATLAGIACNDIVLWFMSSILHPVLLNATLWANASKILAIGGTVMVSYLGMRLWVFVRHAQKEHLTSDKELGVHHLPRQAGHATGAHLRVILRAFRELFVHARKWHREEQEAVQAQVVNDQRGAKHHS